MATHAMRYDQVELHDHAGARWLAGFSLPFLLTILTAFLMLVYPHVSA